MPFGAFLKSPVDGVRYPTPALAGRAPAAPAAAPPPFRHALHADPQLVADSSSSGSAKLTTKWLRRGTHRSVRELVASIRTWITNWNDEPNPFIWHKTADEILDSLATYCQRITGSGH
jgi:hypothetical protein